MTQLPNTWLNLIPFLERRFGGKIVDGMHRLPPGVPQRVPPLSSECLAIENHSGAYRTDELIAIPADVAAHLARYRPTSIHRAERWGKSLGFGGEIWVKREDLTPSGSHKFNAALPQAYYAKKQGLCGIVTETGAGQWGLAMAMTCSQFGLQCVVFMPGPTYDRKQLRRRLIEINGAKVCRTLSEVTLDCDKSQIVDHGSLSRAMSEAYNYAVEHEGFCLAQGCMSFFAPMHQSVIGQETEEDLSKLGLTPDLLVACAGGGTNLIGFMAPWIARALSNGSRSPRMLAVESAEAPALTQGRYDFDRAETSGASGESLMYTLGVSSAMPDIEAAGLRYHAKSPLLSLLVHERFVEATAVSQHEAQAAGIEFYRTEGVLPAPETAHALAAVRRAALSAAKDQRKPLIVVCLSGSGLLDIPFYGT